MPPANLPQLSAQPSWLPAAPEFVLEAFSRLQPDGKTSIRGRQITPEHIIDARRSANLILGDYSNRGINLWTIPTDPDICIPLIPGQREYPLPIDTVDLLDSNLRTFTPSGTTINVGNILTPETDFSGNPTLSAPYGDVGLMAPGSQTIATMAGSLFANLNWPAHGQPSGYPLFWQCPISAGGVLLPPFSVASATTPNSISLLNPAVALETQNGNAVATPLLVTRAGSPIVVVYLPGHGQAIGSSWSPGISTNVGGLTISGSYDVIFVLPNRWGKGSYAFTISTGNTTPPYQLSDQGAVELDDQGFPLISPSWTPDGPVASANKAVFVNNGQLPVQLQAPGTFPTDVFLWPLSRDDYSMIPLKDSPGNPTSYWYSRTNPPKVLTWPVAPNFEQGAIFDGPFLGMISYRTRDPQVFNPGMGQTPDVPRRGYQAFISELTAALAEKYAPAQFASKVQLAAMAWARFAEADREKVGLHLVPELSAYFM